MLTGRQMAFVEEYLIDLDPHQAALRAGYYSGTTGQSLLKKKEIRELIDAAMKERQERTQVTIDMVVAELARIAFSDLKDFVKWSKSGRIGLRPCDQVDGRVLAAIEETVNGKSRTKKVKLYDKLKALELLGRHLGMFNDNLNVNADMKVTIVDDIQ